VSAAVFPWLIVGYHLVAAVALLVEPTVHDITSLHLSPSPAVGAAAFTIGSILAAYGMLARKREIWLYPQQLLLVLAGLSAIMAALSGQYPDGYVPAGGWVFIGTDQAVYPLIAAAHWAEMRRLEFGR